MIKYIHIVLAIWIFVLVSTGFSESFTNRPTASEMEGLVVSGTQCTRGVNERCQAAQVSPPFVKTDSAGWYLDQSTMGTVASTARSLVSYYVNPDTVYNGTTNIVMLAVTNLWAQLKIGDWTNQFTGTPAIGTNSATYGDYPWRISQTNLDERYKVLNALKWFWKAGTIYQQGVRGKITYGDNCDSAYANSETEWASAPWWDSSAYNYLYFVYAEKDVGNFVNIRRRGTSKISGLSTNILHSYDLYYKATDWGASFSDLDGLGFVNGQAKFIETIGEDLSDTKQASNSIGDIETSPISLTALSCPWGDVESYACVADAYWAIKWNFQYCTDE